MSLGILHRYVMGQVFRAFALAQLTLTSVIVLIMLMTEASRQGLPPEAILKLIPFVVPSTLPYTIPVAMLFAVTVVYGRLASDNEVIAVKAAGCSVWRVLGPSLWLAGALSVILGVLNTELIPRATYAFRLAIFKDAEESFYTILKREREINNPRWPFFIGVKDVQGRLLLGATFKHRAQDATTPNQYDFTVQAEKAVIRFDLKSSQIIVKMRGAVMQGPCQTTHSPEFTFEYPIPSGNLLSLPNKRVEEMTAREISLENSKALRKLRTERPRQAISAAMWIASGRLERVNWPEIREAYRNDQHWRKTSNALQTERQLRFALACGVFLFALLGAPVGMLFAKRDFLSAFITCFIPIIVIYYPLVLAGINMGKEGMAPHEIVWLGDLVLLVLAMGFALPPVRRH